MTDYTKIYELLRAPNYQPKGRRALARKIKVPSGEINDFYAWVDAEEAAGRVSTIRDGLVVVPESIGLIAGRISMNERGFGFLLADQFEGPDVFVPAPDTHTAFHGDRVLVRLNDPTRRHGRDRRHDDKPSGKIIKVLERSRTQFVGTLQKTKLFYYVVPDDSRMPHDLYVSEPNPPVKLGHKVVVRLRDWASRHVNPEGDIVEVLGSPDKPGVDILSIIRKHELPEDFPPEVEDEAKQIPTRIPPQEAKRREDFRGHFVLTVDPDDARDFDDALSYIERPKGELEVFIHIADVSHYVTPGSALDKEAARRGNSTYLVDRVLPMLPEKLCNGICSLKPHEDRLVKTAIVVLGRKGEITSWRFAEGIIHSKQRLTYQEAYKMLQKPPHTKAGDAVKRLGQMAQILRKRRMANGALNLGFPEVKVRLDDAGRPIKLDVFHDDESHQLIEEYMLLANEVVATELKRRHAAAVYRVHDDPDPDRLEEYRSNLKALGLTCGNLSQRGEIQKLLKRTETHRYAALVKVNLLKSLRRAEYSPKPEGHFGLSKVNYTHFTSPIRRYADLIVHRSLFAQKGQRTPGNQMADISRHINRTERASAEGEMESKKLKKLEYFHRLSKGKRKPVYEATITDVKSMGLIIELPEAQLQGLLHVKDMTGDVYHYNPRRAEYKGRRAGSALRLGDTIRVTIAEVDFLKRQMRFALAKPRSQR